jgi:ketosteroid isomerase-like protein
MRKLVLFAAAPFLVAASPDWKQQALASAGPSIDKANSEWERAIVTGDADVLAAPYDANGVFIGPDGSTVRGREAVHEMYAKRRADVRVLNASIKSEGRVAADPDDVYEWGSATMTVSRAGTVKQGAGRYLTVWHRDGQRWSITRNIAF